MIGRLLTHWSSLASIGVRGVSVLAGFGISWWLGNRFGPAANGQYALVTQTAMVLSIVAVGGLDLAVVREFSRTVALGRPLSRDTLARLLLVSLAVAGVLAAGVFAVGGERLEGWLGERLPAASLVVLAILLTVRAVTRVTSAVLRSQRRYVLGQVVEVLVIPGAVLALLLAGLLTTLGSLLVATAAVGVAAAIGGTVAALSVTRGGAQAVRIPLMDTIRTAGPLWGVALALNFGDWYGLAVVAAREGVFDAGLYRVALQIASSLAIVSMGLFGVYAPKIGAAFAAEDPAAVGRLTRSATRLSLVLVLPAAAVLIVASDPILGLLGPQFVQARDTLRILAAGQALYAITGPSGLTLALAGHGRVNLTITTVSLLALLIAAPVAAGWGGIEAVAVTISALLIGRNLLSLAAVRRLTGINVLTGRVDAGGRARTRDEKERTA